MLLITAHTQMPLDICLVGLKKKNSNKFAGLSRAFWKRERRKKEVSTWTPNLYIAQIPRKMRCCCRRRKKQQPSKRAKLYSPVNFDRKKERCKWLLLALVSNTRSRKTKEKDRQFLNRFCKKNINVLLDKHTELVQIFQKIYLLCTQQQTNAVGLKKFLGRALTHTQPPLLHTSNSMQMDGEGRVYRGRDFHA